MFIIRLLRAARRRFQAWRWTHLACPATPALQLPLVLYSLNGGLPFGTSRVYNGTNWGQLLGDECMRQAGTPVHAAGAGRVVYARLHPPRSDRPRNWGTVVVIAHRHTVTRQVFYSVYGSLTNVQVAAGTAVTHYQLLGAVAEAGSQENGGWDEAGLFFGIYTGPWRGHIIPGCYREDQGLTRFEWWHEPQEFIRQYRT